MVEWPGEAIAVSSLHQSADMKAHWSAVSPPELRCRLNWEGALKGVRGGRGQLWQAELVIVAARLRAAHAVLLGRVEDAKGTHPGQGACPVNGGDLDPAHSLCPLDGASLYRAQPHLGDSCCCHFLSIRPRQRWGHHGEGLGRAAWNPEELPFGHSSACH